MIINYNNKYINQKRSLISNQKTNNHQSKNKQTSINLKTVSTPLLITGDWVETKNEQSI